MSWNPNTEPVDYVEIAGQRSPGLAEIVGAGSPRDWDERRGIGLSGARLRYRGLKLARFTIQLRLISQEDFDAWETWKSVVQRTPAGERERAQDIAHPILEDCGIRSAVVEDVSQLTQTDDGEWTVEIKMIEHRPPVPAVTLVDGSNQTTADPLDLEIERTTRALNEALAEEERDAA